MSNDKTGGAPEKHAAVPMASYSLTLRLKLHKSGGTLGKVLKVISDIDGTDTGAIDVVRIEDDYVVRDVTVNVASIELGEHMVAEIKKLDNVEVVNVSDRTFLMHLGGKITIKPRTEIKTRDDLSMIYTPGVARVCKAIEADPSKARTLTIKGNTVAVITDGSRILALGNIGPKAGMPVMEGKSALFKAFADVDAFPLALDTNINPLIELIKKFKPDFDASDAAVQETLRTELTIMVARAVAPAFGAFNLEDIASPRCYDVEDRLRSELDIPIFHDDQHGTAIVVTAATLNAAKLTRKRLANMKVVALGVGAAGMACCKMLLKAGVKNLIGFNINGAVHKGRTDLTTQERWLAEHSNPHGFTGSVEEALKGADMVLGLAAAGAIKPHWLKAMKKNAIVFALANPVPEVLPEEAAPYVRIMATGGSNYPNQINNALVFPGFFRGLLDARTTEVTDDMKMEAARQLAAVIPTKELRDDYIIPTVFDPRVATAVADAVKKIAERDRAAATTGGAEPKGMVGCGTAEVMFKASVKKQFGEVDGVVGIEVKKDKIVLRVRDEATKAKLPASFRNRPIEVKVTGNVTKRTPAKK